jgi:hypothetical protein
MVDETSVEFRACVRKAFWRKVWDTIGIWVCIGLVALWLLCVIIAGVSIFIPQADWRLTAIYPVDAILIARLGSVLGVVAIIGLAFRGIWKEAIEECRKIYAEKEGKDTSKGD